MKVRLNASSVVVGLAIGALTAGGITYAAANTGGTTINACQTKSTGALRMLTAAACKSTETPVSWNTQGVQGPKGDVGSQGPKGDRGPAAYENSVEGLAKAMSVNSIWLNSGLSYVPGSVDVAVQDVRAHMVSNYGVPGVGWADLRVVSDPVDESCRSKSGVSSQFRVDDGTMFVNLGHFDNGVCVSIAGMAPLYVTNSSSASARLVILTPEQMALGAQ